MSQIYPSTPDPRTPPTGSPGGSLESSIPPAQLAAPAAPTAPGTLRMANVASVNWSSVLEFTQLFRGFRLAINPAKVLLALLAILLIYTAGRAFDGVWGFQVYDGEIERFQQDKPDVYRGAREQQLDSRRSSLETMLELESGPHPELTTERIADLRDHPNAAFRELKSIYEQEFQDDVKEAHSRRLNAEQERSSGVAFARGAATPREQENNDRAAAARRLFNRVQSAKLAVGRGVFDAFLEYEIREFDALVDNTLTFVRVAPVQTTSQVDIEGSAVSGGLLSKKPERLWRSDTVVGCIANMTITGPVWLFSGTAPMQWRPAVTMGCRKTWGGWLEDGGVSRAVPGVADGVERVEPGDHGVYGGDDCAAFGAGDGRD